MQEKFGYSLVDAGEGRRLEEIGDLVLDRPAPGTVDARRNPDAWTGAITYRSGRGWATADGGPAPPDEVSIEIAGLRMIAGLAPGGQIGLFPEHAQNAAWLRARPSIRAGSAAVLNLFAYTGLLTLVAAGAGASVTHLDASRPAVAWARRNAAASGRGDSPVRWIVDDALAFVRREARRQRRYAGIVLDPPSYGHGGHGHAGAFRFDADIDELLEACRAVAAPDAFWLLSTHTIGWDARRLSATLAGAIGVPVSATASAPLDLEATSGARLALGVAARFDPRDPHRR